MNPAADRGPPAAAAAAGGRRPSPELPAPFTAWVWTGPKPVCDAKGRFKDIQTYERAHSADLQRKSKNEQ